MSMPREIRQLSVFFKDPNNTYKAGDVVNGYVAMDLGGELKVKSVRMSLNGIAKVHWDEDRTYTKGSASKLSHKNVDAYLDETVILVSNTETLAPGRLNWPFTVRLPPYLPASFEGQYGKVQYWARVLFERPWKGNFEYTKNFNVQGALDLNTDPDAKKSIENLGEAMVGLCCKTGPLTGQIYLDKRGYTAGQNIAFTAKVENNSKKKANIRVILSQQAVYKADNQTRRVNNMIKGLLKGEVAPGETADWEDEIKNIPPLPPSRLGGGCKHIDVHYTLTLVAETPGPGKDLDVPVEVIIGTIPLRKVAADSGTPKLTVKATAKMNLEAPEAAVLMARRRSAEPPGLRQES